MVHPDGTMDVRINGEIKRRPVDYKEVAHGYMNIAKHFPVTIPGEMVIWQIDSDIPFVVRGGNE